MSERNQNWDPNGNAPPVCDDCVNKIASVYCFNCNDKRDLSEFKRMGYMSTHFMITTALKYDQATRDGDIPTRDAYEGAFHAMTMVEMAVKQFRTSVWPNVHTQVNA